MEIAKKNSYWRDDTECGGDGRFQMKDWRLTNETGARRLGIIIPIGMTYGNCIGILTKTLSQKSTGNAHGRTFKS